MEPDKPTNETTVKNASAENKHTGQNPIRADLAELIKRQSFGADENRPEAVKKRKQKNQRTARANIEDLCDPGSFIEYGALAIAAQRT
ncbi:MAG TPA: hypothetical protein P5347_01390, partial [Smithellaceae bacterium]|nr:hypothetical protein [Smithellaceae bacterium]